MSRLQLLALIPIIIIVQSLLQSCSIGDGKDTEIPIPGSPDMGFGLNGITIHDNATGEDSNDSCGDIAIDANGKILAAGASTNGTSTDAVVWRFNPDGTLDLSFNGTGFVVHNSAAGGNGTDLAKAIEIDANGKILAAGNSSNGSDFDLALWRFNPDGTLDISFDGDGIVTHNNAAGGNYEEIISDMCLDAGGKILIVGNSYSGSSFDMVIWRFNTDGSLDTTFDGDGIVISHNAAGGNDGDDGMSITTDSLGRILVAGRSDGVNIEDDMVVWRYNPDGTLDTTFNTTGIAVFDNTAGGSSADQGYAIVMDNLERIVVTGRCWNVSGEDMFIWRFNTDGSLDPSFGSNGFIHYDRGIPGNFDDLGNAIRVDSDGRIIVAGYTDNGTDQDMTLWRYNQDGSLDVSFGNNGVVIENGSAGGNNDDLGLSVILDSSGRIVVGGYSYNIAGNIDMTLWRFWP